VLAGKQVLSMFKWISGTAQCICIHLELMMYSDFLYYILSFLYYSTLNFVVTCICVSTCQYCQFSFLHLCTGWVKKVTPHLKKDFCIYLCLWPSSTEENLPFISSPIYQFWSTCLNIFENCNTLCININSCILTVHFSFLQYLQLLLK